MSRTQPWWRQVVVQIALAWMAGLVLGRAWEVPAIYLGLAAAATGAGICLWGVGRRRNHATRMRKWPTHAATALALLSVICSAGLWWSIRTDVSGERWLHIPPVGERRLVDVEGIIAAPPRLRTKASGAMARFDYQPTGTSFIIRADRIHGVHGSRPLRGGLIVNIPAYDARLRAGDRVRLQGWLMPLTPPKNPGQFNYKQWLNLRGVVARVVLETRGNCRILIRAEHRPFGVWRGWRHTLQTAAASALHRGLPPMSAPARGLIDAMLIGKRDAEARVLEVPFRRLGLTHLLSISGLHLAILALGVWWLTQAATGRPRWATLATVAAIGGYVLILPPEVPILRSAFMTAAGALALTRGRRVSIASVLAAAALVLLIWRPWGLFSAGFQLSFGIVAALIAFTPRVSRWIWRPRLDEHAGRGWVKARRYLSDSLAASLVAWLIALPVVIYHFQMISLGGVAWTLLTLPLTALVLWAGFAKIILTMLYPPLGAWIAPILASPAEAMVHLAAWGAQIPGVAIHTPAPSLAWALITLALIIAALSGRFSSRPAALTTCALACGLWLFAPSLRNFAAEHIPQGPAVRVNMFAVGSGSAYLVRADGRCLMFDCGSSSYLDITTVAIAPALRSLGVRHVNTLMLSHPDLDHFSGAIELIDQFGVERVICTPYFLRAAKESPHSAEALLIEKIRNRDVPIVPVVRGWSHRWGNVELQVLWPPPGMTFEEDNDSSLMLLIHAADRRILLCGDIQQEAMSEMLQRSLVPRADVVELPHHGSFIPIAPVWLRAVQPRIVLQSADRDRLRDDPWAKRLTNIQRYVTAVHGMVALRIHHNGRMTVDTFRPPEDGRKDMPKMRAYNATKLTPGR